MERPYDTAFAGGEREMVAQLTRTANILTHQESLNLSWLLGRIWTLIIESSAQQRISHPHLGLCIVGKNFVQWSATVRIVSKSLNLQDLTETYLIYTFTMKKVCALG